MKPKLSLGSWAFAFGPFANEPWPFERVLQYTSEAGYNGIEINGFSPHPTDEEFDTLVKRKELCKRIEAYGLGVSGYAPSFVEVPPDRIPAELYVERIKRAVAFAGDLGTNRIRIDTVSAPSSLTEEAFKRRFEHLSQVWRAAAEAAGAEGAEIVWEFEPGFWLNKPSEVLAMCHAVDSPYFRILFDTSHAYMGAVMAAKHFDGTENLEGGVTAYAKLLAPHIGHFHLIDSDGTLHNDETSTHAEFGNGFVNFPQLLQETGPLFLDMEWWGVDFCFNAEVEVWGRKAVPYIQQLISEVHSSK
ncbi:sugar phosphate isomerase/epimerase [Paenibacillus psychroresistens]|uniref:Sugar phosphate isomerase/epimerase n=1 Tax=Paenibacillus psychroresistens TaxID=1778678 RepID=A0A6B8RVE9_9BACL|nr:sugar phosphate isomerase/epimerase family protein [Paenibacillus psychroresistens]QGQ99256.1 sugar phosphate isomerase/epimerase [Paenibacillus psychroresistens]